MPEPAVRNVGLSNGKSICVVLVVIACFAVLWPKIFYPMLMTGIHLSTNSPQKANGDVDFQMLPPKVREAIKKSPTKEAGSPVHRLPGRPQFYAGRDRTSQQHGGSSGGMWNIMVPIYTIIIVVFFLYFILKLAFAENNAQDTSQQVPPPLMHDVNQCHECQYQYQEMRRNPNRFDPYTSRPSYKAFDSYGRQNVSRCMHNLIQDMQVFRQQLVGAEICKCKMNMHKNTLDKKDENEVHIKDEDEFVLDHKDEIVSENFDQKTIITAIEEEIENNIDFGGNEKSAEEENLSPSEQNNYYDDEAQPEGENYFLAKGKATMDAHEEYAVYDKENVLEDEETASESITLSQPYLHKRKGAQRKRRRNKTNKDKKLNQEGMQGDEPQRTTDSKVLQQVNKRLNKKQLKNE